MDHLLLAVTKLNNLKIMLLYLPLVTFHFPSLAQKHVKGSPLMSFTSLFRVILGIIHLSHEKKSALLFMKSSCLIGILIMVYYNPI